MLVAANAITSVNKRLFSVVKWGVYAMAGLMVFEVLARYWLTAPTSWAPELAALLFGPFFLLGGPWLLHLGGHVAVDIVSARTTGRVKKTLALSGMVLAMLFGTTLLWFGFPLALDSFSYAETSYSGWDPIIWPAKAALPLAALLLVLQAMAECVFIVKDSREI